jgi:hypothetical protein
MSGRSSHRRIFRCGRVPLPLPRIIGPTFPGFSRLRRKEHSHVRSHNLPLYVLILTTRRTARSWYPTFERVLAVFKKNHSNFDSVMKLISRDDTLGTPFARKVSVSYRKSDSFADLRADENEVCRRPLLRSGGAHKDFLQSHDTHAHVLWPTSEYEGMADAEPRGPWSRLSRVPATHHPTIVARSVR